MTYSHLNGQIFKRDGTIYLVMETNDWAAETLNVRTVNAGKEICRMARDDVLRGVAERRNRTEQADRGDR